MGSSRQSKGQEPPGLRIIELLSVIQICDYPTTPLNFSAPEKEFGTLHFRKFKTSTQS